MKSRRMLSRLALLGFALSLPLMAGRVRTAEAATCPYGGPVCVTSSDCTSYCLAKTGYPGPAICNGLGTPHCCICAD
jgi:hypothetical protein